MSAAICHCCHKTTFSMADNCRLMAALFKNLASKLQQWQQWQHFSFEEKKRGLFVSHTCPLSHLSTECILKGFTLDNKKITTIADVEAWAAEQGIALSPKDRKDIALAQQAELARLELLYKDAQPKTFADRWNEFYPRLLESIVSAGETVLTFSEAVLVNLGVPIVLVLLLIVEHQRVVHGIMLFEGDEALAAFAAAALVMLNLVLEFQTHHVEHKAGYVPDVELRPSLRITAGNLLYWLGISQTWQQLLTSPARRYQKLLRLVTFTILALALAGSMRGVIQQQQGTWYQALVSIVLESNLSLMTTWLGGLLFAAAAVLSAQGLSRYIAIRCVEILARQKARQQTEIAPHTAALEQAGASVAMAIINKKLAEKESKTVQHFLALQTNGNGNGNHNGNGHYSGTE